MRLRWSDPARAWVKPLAALDHFEKVDAAQIPVRIEDVVRAAYRLVAS
jgi:hypothetical protein